MQLRGTNERLGHGAELIDGGLEVFDDFGGPRQLAYTCAQGCAFTHAAEGAFLAGLGLGVP